MAGLNLLAAIVIYWNTAHLSDAIAQRKGAGLPVEPELLAHMSALTIIDGAVFTVFDGLRYQRAAALSMTPVSAGVPPPASRRLASIPSERPSDASRRQPRRQSRAPSPLTGTDGSRRAVRPGTRGSAPGRVSTRPPSAAPGLRPAAAPARTPRSGPPVRPASSPSRAACRGARPASGRSISRTVWRTGSRPPDGAEAPDRSPGQERMVRKTGPRLPRRAPLRRGPSRRDRSNFYGAGAPGTGADGLPGAHAPRTVIS